MNTGLGDAANLAWKLAAVVQGWASDRLLHTYQNQRHPVGEQVIHNSSILLNLALGRRLWQRVARNVVPLVAGNIGPITDRLSETMSGIGITYPASSSAHEAVGTRAPDITLTPLVGGRPSRLYEALRSGRLVCVSSEPIRSQVPPDWAGHVDVEVPVSMHGIAATTVLIAPDGYVIWASDTGLEGAPPLESVLTTAAVTN